ncbi:PepSY-associated TM helix domain-containing protein [Streptomyces caniscabiei]|uniref:PepSY domain-containing protein n=1 Tax=Streptomyces caniscabiei TaxID=2746961 RepID=A0A927KZ75_9ACTN|nr:PepSY domain-containing protein [Streptomyces caniscabiei]MBD9722437.1 PepSY domain-containing protein [Streptomyces caniscabiei]MDX3514363.1 PepSY domain-containing protein [Streptomyces caniscabiei]MDX3716611.1 PepSY domain-containing protein [Streptomyces caniscabiei]MDX3731952.1 PepSY domain-containing protein [Streptomyces caniscabiei]WEO22499.1 PepSY domain-containing protein [Streptomyces caniscabiei]
MTIAPSTETDEPQKPLAQPEGSTRGWASLRPLVLRLHFYAGVLVAPFLLVAAVTGGLYAASFTVERIVYADQTTVAKIGDAKLPISEQVAAARKAHPEGTLSAVRPSPEDDATTRVMLTGVEGIDETNTLAVFVDPYTAEVRGALEQYGSTGALPVRTWIDKFHANLQLGETGRLYSELAASWLWVISGGGLVLWFARRRAQRKVRGTSGRRRTLGLHGTVGVWAALGFFFLSATGLTWSTYAGANIEVLRTELHQATPAISSAAGDHGAHTGGSTDGTTAPEGDLDKILAAARTEGLGDPVEIVPPADASSTYVVKQVQRSWPTKQDAVAVDPATAEVTDTLRFADFPILAKLSRWGIDAHTGVLFGLANQLLLIALAASLVVLIVWGYRMWWQRGRASSFGRPVPRGAWQHVPPQILVPTLAVIAVLGYFVPLLGIPLAVFIAVDVALSEIAHRRGKRSYDGRVGAK